MAWERVAMMVRVIVFVFMQLLISVSVIGQSLDFLFEQHPPFTFTENGRVTGLFVEPTENAATIAGFDIIWHERTFNRIKRELEEGNDPVCVTGHTVNTVPSPKYRATLPIGHFGRSGLLIRNGNRLQFEKLKSVRALFEQTTLIGGFVKGAKYAVPYERFLTASHNKHLIVASTHEILAQLVARGRLDFIFENELMLEVHQQQNLEQGEKLSFIALPGMPTARKAHIVCTLAVQQGVVDKLNAGIEKHTLSKKNR